MKADIEIVGTWVSVAGTMNRVQSIIHEVSNGNTMEINYMELWVVVNLFPDVVWIDNPVEYLCKKSSIYKLPNLNKDIVHKCISQLQPDEDIQSDVAKASASRALFEIRFKLIGVGDDYFSSEKLSSLKPSDSSTSSSFSKRREDAIAEATASHAMADGSVVLTQKDGSIVKLKSKLKEMGKRRPESMESTGKGDDKLSIALDQKSEILRKLKHINSPDASKKTIKTIDSTIEREAEEDKNISADKNSAISEYWKEFFEIDGNYMYLDESENREYLSLQELLKHISKHDNLGDIKKKICDSSGKVREASVAQLIERISSMSEKISLGRYKDVAFHDKDGGRRFLLTLIEIIIDGNKMELDDSKIKKGKILQRYHIKTISEKNRIIDMMI